MYKFPPLREGRLLRRYKRFFADIETEDGVITVHNPNTGSMRSLLEIGNPVLYSVSDNPKRSLPCTLELIHVSGEWIVSNTARANHIIEAAFIAGAIPSVYSGGHIRREYPYRDSRIDFLLENGSDKTLVEVKSVTYFDDDNLYFPDAVTKRGLKHIRTLESAVSEGYRAVMLYVCMANRPFFSCASHIDPEYCVALDVAKSAGLEAVAVCAEYDEHENAVYVSIGGITIK